MTDKTLAKLYPQLTVAERFPLMIAAHHRKDEAECERLINSAPRVTITVPHTHVICKSFFTMILAQQSERLALAGWFLYTLSIAREAEREGTVKRRPRKCNAALIYAWRFQLDERAWRLFCLEKCGGECDPLDGLPGHELLTTVRDILTDWIIDPKLVASVLKVKVEELPTVENRLQDMRGEWGFWESSYSVK